MIFTIAAGKEGAEECCQLRRRTCTTTTATRRALEGQRAQAGGVQLFSMLGDGRPTKRVGVARSSEERGTYACPLRATMQFFSNSISQLEGASLFVPTLAKGSLPFQTLQD